MTDIVKSWVNRFRDKPGDWEITDLLDEDEGLAQVLYRTENAATIQTLTQGCSTQRGLLTSNRVCENTNEWFEIVANIEKDDAGQSPH